MFLILDPSSRTGYLICRAQHKMKIQASLFKNLQNFNTARIEHKNPVQGSSECGGSVPLYTSHWQSHPCHKHTGVTNVENFLGFWKDDPVIMKKKVIQMEMMHPRTNWKSCDNYVTKIHTPMASDMLHVFTV